MAAPRQPKPRSILVKVVAQVVTATQEGDKILAEQEGPRIACYTVHDLGELWQKAEAEVEELNAQQANLNRAARRQK